MKNDKQAPRRKLSPALITCLSISQASLVLLCVSFYTFRPSQVYAITVYPAWVVGILLFVPILNFIKRRKLFFAHFALVLGFIFIFSDEPSSLLRGVVPRKEGSYRVVSLNCAGGMASAAEEAFTTKPDLVLLQETPSSKEVEKLRTKFGYEAVVGLDGTILGRGTLTAVTLPKSVSNFTAAVWSPPNSVKEFFVVSLRLQPPIFRLDLLSPGMWKQYQTNKESRAQEITEIVEFIRPLIQGRPLIIGGDFNTTPDWRITEPLHDLASDSIPKVGTGWGGTGTNDYPVVRFDQIWFSKELVPRTTWVKKTVNSDHRMVLASFDFN